MLLIICYLRKNIVYVPTLNKVQTGGHVELDPVGVSAVSDMATLRNVFQEAIARTNPIIPYYTYENNPEPVILKYAGLKSYSTFARGALPWLITEKDGIYQVIGQKKLRPRGWVDDPEHTITFPAGSTSDDVIDQVIAVLQASAA